MSDLNTSLAEILTQRFVELFEVSLNNPLKPAMCSPDQVPFVAPLYHASISLTGEDIEGVLIIIADKKFLHQTHPERRYGGILEAADYIDWLGEISNRTLATSKPSILDLGYHLKLEQPKTALGLPQEKAEKARELTQVLESEGFYATLCLRIKKILAASQRVG